MALQRRQAVDDVNARLLQLLRPADVGALVEARLQLDHADGLLAALRRLDQRRDQRGVGAGPVHGLLDRQHLGIVNRLLDEPVHRAAERVVRVVDEDVRFPDRREDVGLRPVLAQQPRLRNRGVRRVAQLAEATDPARPGPRRSSSPSFSEPRRRSSTHRGAAPQPRAHGPVDLSSRTTRRSGGGKLLLDRRSRSSASSETS